MARDKIVSELWDAMRSLYQARYAATGPEGPVDGQYYPEMDRQAFDDIVQLQDKLQNLILRLEKEMKSNEQSDRPQLG